MTSDRALGAYVRGRLLIAGVRGKTPIADVLDVLTVIAMDTPGKALTEWRQGLDRIGAQYAARARATELDRAQVRASWGLAPHQVDAHRRFHEAMSGGERT